MFKRALAIREQKLGASHLETIESLTDLASLYYEQGKYAEAEPLYKRALAMCEEVLGQDHSLTQTVRGNMTNLLQKMHGDLEGN